MPYELRTALIVAVPEAAPAVDPWRERTCADKPSIGVPAHITLLFPFIPAARVDEQLLAKLRDLFGAASGFEFELGRTARFPTTLYLAPEPSEPFVRLTEAIVGRYPAFPPYAGAFDEIVPHLTVAHGDDEVLDRAATDVEPSLPIAASVQEATLLVEVEPNWGRWTTRDRFPLG